MATPGDTSPNRKRRHAKAAWVWAVAAGAVLLLEAVGLHDKGRGWGPLSHAVWVVTEAGPHGPMWWLVGAGLTWLTLHFLFPHGIFGWAALLWIVLLSLVAWSSGRFLFGLF